LTVVLKGFPGTVHGSAGILQLRRLGRNQLLKLNAVEAMAVQARSFTDR